MAQDESSDEKSKSIESLTKVLRLKSDGITNDTEASDIVKCMRMILHIRTTLASGDHDTGNKKSTTGGRVSEIANHGIAMTSHVVRVQINHERKMAFIEFDSKETATAVLTKYKTSSEAPLFNEHKCEVTSTTRDSIKIPVPANQIDITYHEYKAEKKRVNTYFFKKKKKGDYEGRLAFAPPPPRTKRQGDGLYEVEVAGFEVHESGKHALFQIVLYEENVKKTQVLKRYSEIWTLHENLTKLKDVWTLVVIKNLKFPPKTITKSLDDKFLESRKQLLQGYFDDLFTRFNKAKMQIAAVPLLSEFFGLMKG
ncbi:hypothetical protein RFI_21557 [Reticulomyxa filosa]|uniref:PX domain-containing protein n=1 Tax=Reticulomyxa filosa TaxID=46433 RepID=X6MQT9_RETFI|nr:hypothetical protein RFI_21557 [Reticulomyxa filosa]|eukprot:ETO15807.1 hypothetical protein RFI_21557 [Reticulomyxa filosa]